MEIPLAVPFGSGNGILTHFLGSCMYIYRHFQSQSGEIGHGHGGNVAQECIVHLGLVVLAAAVLKIMIIVGLVLQFGHNQLINQQN